MEERLGKGNSLGQGGPGTEVRGESYQTKAVGEMFDGFYLGVKNLTGEMRIEREGTWMPELMEERC